MASVKAKLSVILKADDVVVAETEDFYCDGKNTCISV